jgi:hypothetical protein
VFAKNGLNSNIPALRVLTADGLGGTYWAIPSSLGMNPSFNEIITSAGTYTADLSFNKFRLLAGENIGMVDGPTGSNQTTLFAKAYSQIDVSGENTLNAFSNGQLDSSLRIAGQGGIQVRADPGTNTLFIEGPTAPIYVVSTNIYGFSQLYAVPTTSSVTSNITGLAGTYITADSSSTVLKFLGLGDILLSTNVSQTAVFFGISSFTSKGYLDISANAYGAYPSTLSTVSSLYVQGTTLSTSLQNYSTTVGNTFSSFGSSFVGYNVSTGYEIDELWGAVNSKAPLIQLVTDVSNIYFTIASTMISTTAGLGTAGYLSTAGDITTAQLVSTNIGLGTLGYLSTGTVGDVTSFQLLSTVGGLGTIGYISTFLGVTSNQLVSTVEGLGTVGYISTLGGGITSDQLVSTTIGLGTTGYISSLSSIQTSTILNTGALSTSFLTVYGSSLTVQGSTILNGTILLNGTLGGSNTVTLLSNLTSSIAGLGTAGYISTGAQISLPNLISTVAGLGNAGYLSSVDALNLVTRDYYTVQTASTVTGLGSSRYLSSGNGVITISTVVVSSFIGVQGGVRTQQFQASSMYIGETSSNSAFTLDVAGSARTTSLFTSSIVVSSVIGSVLGSFPSLSSIRASTGTLYASSITASSIFVFDTISTKTMAVYGPETLVVDGNTILKQSVGIGLINPQTPLDVGGIARAINLSSLSLTISSLNGQPPIGGTSLLSTIDGLGTYGYISSLSLRSSIVSTTAGIQATSGLPSTVSTSYGTSFTTFRLIPSSITNVNIPAPTSGLWVVVGNTATDAQTIKYSSDGITWTNSSGLGFESQGFGIAWNGRMWVAVGSDLFSNPNTIQYSFDGITWVASSSGGFNGAGGGGKGVAWNGRMWVAVGVGATAAATIQYSYDGINWSNSTSGGFSGGAGFSVAWNGRMWVAVGLTATDSQTIQYSYDGMNWSFSSGPGFTTQGYGVAWNGRMWVAVGDDTTLSRTIQYSYDGITWFASSSGSFANNGFGVAWNGTLWVAVGSGGSAANNIKYSYDGINWTASSSGGFTGSGRGVAWNGTLWVATGVDGTANNRIKYSFDGINWFNSSGAATFGTNGNGVAFASNFTPSYKQENLSILPQNIPLFLQSTNQILTQPSSFVINNTLDIDAFYNRVGINTNIPQVDLDVAGTTRAITLSSLVLSISSINGEPPLLIASLLSTVDGLGQTYISTPSLLSTVEGLATLGYISSPSLFSTTEGLGSIYISTSGLTSTVTGLGNIYVSTFSLTSTLNTVLPSTVRNLGNIYVSTFSLTSTLNTVLPSTVRNLGNIYVSTFSLTSTLNTVLPSTVRNLGTVYVSTLSLMSTLDTVLPSTVRNLGTFYVSTLSLASTVIGLGNIYVSTPSLTSTLNTVLPSTVGSLANNLSTFLLNASSVGIGTQIAGSGSSNYILNVNGFAQMSTLRFPNTEGRKIVLAAGSDASALVGAYAGFAISTSYVRYSADATTTSHSFGTTAATGAYTEWVRMSNGNVGIGTNATIGPQFLLDVNGAGRFQNISTQQFYTSSISNVNIAPSYSNLWVAVGEEATDNNTIKYSYNGINWSNSAGTGFATRGIGVAWNGQYWIAVGTAAGNASIKYSFNGISWSNVTSGGFATAGYGVAWNGRLWVATGIDATQNIKYSGDGLNWSNSSATAFTTNGWTVGWNGRMWVAGGVTATASDCLKYSFDGINWTSGSGDTFTGGASGGCFGVAWNGRLWIAVGAAGTPAGTIKYSGNGITWSNIIGTGFSSGGNGIGWNGQMWVAGGTDTTAANTLQYSFDGINWSPSASGGYSTAARRVAWNGSFWVATGVDATQNLKYSFDGINWINSSGPTFAVSGFGIAYSSNDVPAYAQQNLSILPQNIPAFLQSTNQIMAQTSSLLINNTLMIDSFANRVGINKNNPAFQLDLNGSIQTNGAIFITSTNTNSHNIVLQWTATNTGAATVASYVRNTSNFADIAFNAVNNGGTSNIMYMVGSNQRVGINTVTPSYTLDVNGTGRVSGTFQSGIRLITSTIAASPTVATTDINSYFLFTTTTASLTINLPAAATAGNGWNVVIRNSPSSTQNFTVNSVLVAPGTTVTVLSDASSLYNF